MSLQPGSILKDRYLIQGQLGKGGMGAVYLAGDQSLQIRVAVKENLNLNPESERQFRREAELLASLRHPNLPRVTDYFILEERQYLVMDYIEGEDLHTHAQQHRPTVEEALVWSNAVCDALAYLHSRQPPIIHRDIKPANLKLQPDGTIILVDFGIAKVFDHAQTSTGARGLTPGFSPPEQYGAKRTDARSDQFSLAATIYTLLTGQIPTDSIERLVKKAELKSARSLNPAIPEHIDVVLNRAMALDQDDRFPDIKNFNAALHKQLVPATALEEIMPQTRPSGEVTAKTSFGETLLRSRLRSSRLGSLLGLGALVLIVIVSGVALALNVDFPISILPATPTSTEPIAVALQPSDTPTTTQTTTPTTPPPTATLTITLMPSLSPTPTLTPTITPVPFGGGGRIAFVSDRTDGILQIWTMNADGSDPRQLTFGPGDKAQPKWSPDGARLLYVTDGGADDFGNDLGLDIMIINADGTGLDWVIHSPGDDTDPAWSPEGTEIAFTSNRIGNLRQVFILETACLDSPGGCIDEEPINISCNVDFCAVEFSPTWAPVDLTPPAWLTADKTLAVAVSINNAPAQIYLRSPDNGVPTDFDRNDRIVTVDHLDWSPDGSTIVFTWYYKRGTNEIYIAPLEDRGWQYTKLTESNGNKEPDFSPDGQWIVFTSTRDQNPEIYLMTSSGIGETKLTNHPGQDMQPDWQPLGSP